MSSFKCEAEEPSVQSFESFGFELQTSDFKPPKDRPWGGFCLAGRNLAGYIAAIDCSEYRLQAEKTSLPRVNAVLRTILELG